MNDHNINKNYKDCEKQNNLFENLYENRNSVNPKNQIINTKPTSEKQTNNYEKKNDNIEDMEVRYNRTLKENNINSSIFQNNIIVFVHNDNISMNKALNSNSSFIHMGI